MSARERVLVGAAVLLSGGLFFFGVGLAIVPVEAATWLAPIPVLLVAGRVPARVAVLAGFAAYLLGTTNSWAYFLTSYDVPPVAGAAIVAFQSLSFAAVVAVFRVFLVRGRPVTAVLAGPAAWVGAMCLLPFVEPYGLAGTLAEQLTARLPLQIAAVTGGLGVDFVLLATACAVASLRPRGLAVGAALLAATLGFGALRLASAGPEPMQRVALVVSNPTHWGPDVATPEGRELLDGYRAQIAALPPGVGLAVLPEGALSVDDTTLPAVEAAFADVARARGTAVVVGLARSVGPLRYANALVVPASSGPAQLYLKHHDLVSPPGHDLTFVPGTPTPTGVLICRDVTFPDVATAYGRAGAGLVAMPASTNGADGRLYARAGALRGIEHGFAVAWPGQQGELLVADRYGTVRGEADRTGPGPFTTVVADVPVAPVSTPYNRLGPWFPWTCLALLGLAVLALKRPAVTAARRGRPGTSP